MPEQPRGANEVDRACRKMMARSTAVAVIVMRSMT